MNEKLLDNLTRKQKEAVRTMSEMPTKHTHADHVDAIKRCKGIANNPRLEQHHETAIRKLCYRAMSEENYELQAQALAAINNVGFSTWALSQYCQRNYQVHPVFSVRKEIDKIVDRKEPMQIINDRHEPLQADDST
jgi:oligoendopeptidase F